MVVPDAAFFNRTAVQRAPGPGASYGTAATESRAAGCGAWAPVLS